MELYPYQQQLIDDLRTSLKQCRSTVAVLGCGGGKSVIAATVAKNATNRGNKVLFLVHVQELLDQIKRTFTNNGVDLDLCDFKMIQTYRRHLQPPDYYNLIIIDEAHLFSKAYQAVIEHHHSAYKVGFTATPVRLTSGGLGNLFADMVTSVTTSWLIDNSYLAPYRYFSVPLADTKSLHIKAGEYVQSEVAELMQTQEVYGNTVANWERLASHCKTIVYCATVEASITTSNEFVSKGYKSVSLDGKTSADERNRAVEAFRNGEVQILCNCQLFSVGFDIPDCDCVVLLRPTQSLPVFIQQSMRSMRYMPDKTALIIDHVGNVYQHGLPDDNREWSLETKKKQENLIKVRECKVCFAVLDAQMQFCPYCDSKLTVAVEKKGTKLVEIDLVELERVENLQKTHLNDAVLTTWEQVVDFQKAKKYKFAWCIRYADKHNIAMPAKYNKMKWRMRR